VSRKKRATSGPRKPCCMVSELLQEVGIDRERLRNVHRQVLESIILACQWQLQRLEKDRPAPPLNRRGRRVEVD
jgi:hypothetical protein